MQAAATQGWTDDLPNITNPLIEMASIPYEQAMCPVVFVFCSGLLRWIQTA
jgi:hypothetical protein